MVNRNGNQRSTRRGSKRQVNPGRVRRIVNRVSLGSRIVPSVDPPVYTAGPWWPLTIVDTVSGDVNYTPDYIHKGILAALNLTGYIKGSTALTFKFRVLSVRAWGLAKQPIQLSVTETHGALTTATSNWVKEINDFGTPLNYSRVGWRFGDIFTHRVFESTESIVLFQTSEAGVKDKVLVYIQLLIRVPNAPDPAVTLQNTVDSTGLSNQFEAIMV